MDSLPPLSTELAVLGWSVLLLLVHIGLQGGLAIPLRGLSWNAGPRDEGQPPLGRYFKSRPGCLDVSQGDVTKAI